MSAVITLNLKHLLFSFWGPAQTSGHSCATVAGAYLIALYGLKALYGQEIPRRGEIKIELKKSPRDDNTGVIGCVLSNITGATTEPNATEEDKKTFPVRFQEMVKTLFANANKVIEIR